MTKAKLPSRKKPSSRKVPSLHIEYECIEGDVRLVAGVDEVGRGCLAGPVVSAAVILDPEQIPPGIRDSKQLTASQRESLDRLIRETAVSVSVGYASVEEIDTLNILQASLRSMERAVSGLDPRPDFILVDGNMKIQTSLPQRCVVGGDGESLSIAAASIVAKVYRDRWMQSLDVQYPGYVFAKNKGYGSREHREGLQERGPSPIHRKTFSWKPV